jgi:hypothetical protein
MLILLCLMGFLETESLRIESVHENVYQLNPPRAADPYLMFLNTKSPLAVKINDHVVSQKIGLGIGKNNLTVDLNGKTIWTDGVGIYGWTDANDPVYHGGGTLETPEVLTIKNGTIVAKTFTNLKNVNVGANVTFVTTAPVVGDDEKLPITYKAISGSGNDALVNNVVWSVDNPAMATWQPRVAADPGNVAGYLVPVGPIGMVKLTATGTNRKGQQVTGSLDIQIVPGAATIIVVESLPAVER